MKKYLLFVSVSIFIHLSAISQYREGEAQPVQDILRVNFVAPGFSFEKSIGKKHSLYLNGFLELAASFSASSSQGTDTRFYLDPAATVHYRYYYNGAKRVEAGKPTHLNNMNYLAALYSVSYSKQPLNDASFEEVDRRPVHKIGVAWGIQRNFPKRFSLDFCIGPGYLFSKGTGIDFAGNIVPLDISRFTTVGQFTLGLWLNKPREEKK